MTLLADDMDINYVASQVLPLDISRVDFQKGRIIKRDPSDPLTIFFSYRSAKLIGTLKYNTEAESSIIMTIIFGHVPFTIESSPARMRLMEEMRVLSRVSSGLIGITKDQRVIAERHIVLENPVTTVSLLTHITETLFIYEPYFEFFEMHPYIRQ